MNAKKPNNLLAPLVIAGITIGFSRLLIDLYL